MTARICGTCNGRGEVARYTNGVLVRDENGFVDTRTCPQCDGEGRL